MWSLLPVQHIIFLFVCIEVVLGFHKHLIPLRFALKWMVNFLMSSLLHLSTMFSVCPSLVHQTKCLSKSSLLVDANTTSVFVTDSERSSESLYYSRFFLCHHTPFYYLKGSSFLGAFFKNMSSCSWVFFRAVHVTLQYVIIPVLRYNMLLFLIKFGFNEVFKINIIPSCFI